MTEDPTLISPAHYPRLVVVLGGRIIEEISMRKEPTIGRAEDNDLRLTDPKVSRHHARIERKGADYVLTDLGSANGTYVEGQRLTEPHTLEQGERFTIGDTEITYLEPGQAFEDTLTMPAPSRAPRRAAAGPPTRAAPPPAPVSEAEPPEGAGRGLILGLGVVGALLVVALIAAILLTVFPGLRAQLGLGGKPTLTASPMVVASPTALVAQETPGEPPTEAPPATPEMPTEEPVPPADQVFNEMLEQAQGLTRRSRFEDAIAIYEDLADQAPEDPRPEIGWAWALIYDYESEEALRHAQRAVDLDPGHAQALTVLARAHIELGNVEEALARAQEAVEAAPGSAEAHAALAEAYLLDGQEQAALDEADLALVQDVNSANAHRIRAWIYHLVDDDMGRAAGEFQVAAGLQPELWLRRHELGLFLLAAENHNTAIIAFQDALGIRPKAATYAAIGEAYYQLGQYDQARASLQQALSAGAENADTLALMAIVLANQDNCAEAQDYIERALALDPVQPRAMEAEELCEQGGPTPEPTVTTSAGAQAPTATPKPTPRPTNPPAALSGRITFPVWNGEIGRYDTYVANADGSGRQLVVEQMHQPAFSPDGAWLAVNGEKSDHMNLFIVRPDGSELTKITENIEDGLPSWSPNGERLAFSSTRHGDKQSRVYVIDEVPFGGGTVEPRPLNFGPDDVRGEYPAWVAGEDGDRIVYKGCDYMVEPARCGLFTMPAAPGPHDYQQLTEHADDTAPAAYGDRIAFMSNRDGNWELYVMNDDGSDLRRLTNNAAHDGLPAWSPDGRTLAFVSNQGGPWAIWAMSPDGSNRRKLFNVGGGGLVFDWQHERIDWAP